MTAHPQDEAIVRDEVEEPGPRASAATRLALAVGILVVGVVVLRQGLSVRGDLAPQGPRFMPVALGVLWLVLGVAHLVQTLTRLRAHDARRRTTPPAEEDATGEGPSAATDPTGVADDHAEGIGHRVRLVLLMAILVAFAYLLFPLGYVLATAILFPAAAATMGSTRHVRDVVIGVGLSLALYYAFSSLLGIALPQGVLPL